MRKTLGIVVCLIWLWGSAAAEEEGAPAPAEPAPAEPTTVEQAARAVLAAVLAKDQDGLVALARRDAPDPWVVAEALDASGHRAEARAFAKAAPRVDVEALPAYLAGLPARADLEAQRALLGRALAALADPASVVKILDKGLSASNLPAARYWHATPVIIMFLNLGHLLPKCP